jgi:hypothetical protein
MSNDRDNKRDSAIRDAVESVDAWRDAVQGASGDAEETAGDSMADAIGALIDALREYDDRFVTADGVRIVDGLRVWDYDREPGTVDFAATEPERDYWNQPRTVRTPRNPMSPCDRTLNSSTPPSW